jgi:C_GCAxxG_C_C family probable redox protein
MKRSEHAAEQFRAGLNCSQAVFGEFAEEYGIDAESAMRIACGFGGGMGRMGHTCGAITGAFMAIGLMSRNPNPCDPIAKARTYGLVQSFAQEWESRNQTMSCRDLLGCDISTPEGFEQAKKLGLLEDKCPKYVRDAVEILDLMF